MTIRQIAINVPDRVLLAEKTDEASFAREVLMLAAVRKKCEKEYGWTNDREPRKQRFGRRGRRRR